MTVSRFPLLGWQTQHLKRLCKTSPTQIRENFIAYDRAQLGRSLRLGWVLAYLAKEYMR